jgi:hypothetical protein
MKQFIQNINYIIKWITFDVLDKLAKRGSRTAHKLACRLLPY